MTRSVHPLLRPLQHAIAGLGLGLATLAAAAGPELAVGIRCESATVSPGATVPVPVEFRAGTADTGGANAIAAVDFAVTFAADAFTVANVLLPPSLAAAGWTVAWERSLMLPETPGRVALSLVPAFTHPVPTLPDGPIVELLLTAAGGVTRCVSVELVADSVVFSAPPLGLVVPAGTLTNGAIALTTGDTTTTTSPPTTTTLPGDEQCQNCTDDDRDGLLDLDDPDCPAGTLSFAGKPEKLTVAPRKKGAPVVSLRGTLDAVFAEPVGSLQLVLRPAGGAAPTCLTVEAVAGTPKGKKTKRVHVFKRQGKKVATLVSDLNKERSTLVAVLPGLAVPADTKALSVWLWAGDAPFRAGLRGGRCTKKGICTFK